MSENLFIQAFGYPPTYKHFSPGRINLIGEHTDYNGGFVLPTALNIGLQIALKPRTDNYINIISKGFDAKIQRQIGEAASGHWSDHILGGLAYAKKNNINHDNGADIAITSTLPVGAGLSSSASIIVGILKVYRGISETNIDDIRLAQIARDVENEFIGVPCGIMDQVAVAITTPGEAIKLDTDTLEYDVIPLPVSHVMAVIHSGHYRQLSEGRYKVRKEECDLIKEALQRNDICRASIIDLDRLSHLPDVIKQRAHHCISEHQRTDSAAKALLDQDMQTFGRLMIESHISMRDDFDITIPAIDALVDDAVTLGATGARMTGGGFGGCIVACVPKENAEDWCDKLIAKHPQAFYVA